MLENSLELLRTQQERLFYFNDHNFHRVIKGFMCQTGLSNNCQYLFPNLTFSILQMIQRAVEPAEGGHEFKNEMWFLKNNSLYHENLKQ